MDQANIVITSVQPLGMPKLEIDTVEWENMSITTQGFNLTWGTRFEIHVYQAIDAATSVIDIKRRA